MPARPPPLSFSQLQLQTGTSHRQPQQPGKHALVHTAWILPVIMMHPSVIAGVLFALLGTATAVEVKNDRSLSGESREDRGCLVRATPLRNRNTMEAIENPPAIRSRQFCALVIAARSSDEDVIVR